MVLHKNAKDLYDTYIKLGSVNFIKFDDDIIRDVGAIINQGHKSMKMTDIIMIFNKNICSDIQKLRTTPPLFRAYEQVYNNLEDNLCPQFYTSDEVGFTIPSLQASPVLLIIVPSSVLEAGPREPTARLSS